MVLPLSYCCFSWRNNGKTFLEIGSNISFSVFSFFLFECHKGERRDEDVLFHNVVFPADETIGKLWINPRDWQQHPILVLPAPMTERWKERWSVDTNAFAIPSLTLPFYNGCSSFLLSFFLLGKERWEYSGLILEIGSENSFSVLSFFLFQWPKGGSRDEVLVADTQAFAMISREDEIIPVSLVVRLFQRDTYC